MQSVCSYMYLILLDLAKDINCAREGNVLNGRNLKVAAENGPPFFMIHEHPEYPGIYMYSGVMEQLLQELRGALNFTTTMLRPVHGQGGGILTQRPKTGVEKLEWCCGMRSILPLVIKSATKELNL